MSPLYCCTSKSFNITLIGKGVCFDSGGLNLKSSSGMLNMKKAMSGAASVLGLAHYLIRSNLKINLRIQLSLYNILKNSKILMI